jgi:hypothetical protein
MNLRALLILSLIIILEHDALSQNKYFGATLGIIPNQLSQPDNKYSGYTIGLKLEYVPKNAIFSVSSDLHYIIHYKTFIAPIAINFKFGNKIKFLINAAVLPYYNRRETDPLNNSFKIGAQLGLGLQILINKQISIISDGGVYLIPFTQSNPSHFGNYTNSQIANRLVYIRIGILHEFGNLNSLIKSGHNSQTRNE